MAIRIDRPRFRAIFSGLGFPRDPAEQFVDVIEDTFNESVDGLATNDYVDHIADRIVNELKRDAAEREARTVQNQLVMVGVILTALAVATGIIIAVVTLT